MPKRENKKSLRQTWNRDTIVEALAALGHDPVRAVINIASGADPEADANMRYSANRDILDRLIPKPRRVEIAVAESDTIAQQEMLSMLRESISRHKRDY